MGMKVDEKNCNLAMTFFVMQQRGNALRDERRIRNISDDEREEEKDEGEDNGKSRRVFKKKRKEKEK